MQDYNSEDLSDSLYEGIIEHGFLFQEKCSELLNKNERETNWLMINTEYPVSIDTKDTRIDILLEDYEQRLRNFKSINKENIKNIYAIVECKKVSSRVKG